MLAPWRAAVPDSGADALWSLLKDTDELKEHGVDPGVSPTQSFTAAVRTLAELEQHGRIPAAHTDA